MFYGKLGDKLCLCAQRAKEGQDWEPTSGVPGHLSYQGIEEESRWMTHHCNAASLSNHRLRVTAGLYC